MKAKVSAATEAKFRDYAVGEPSFTLPFAAWELGLSLTAVNIAAQPLIERGVVVQIEPRRGPYAATYAYDPPKVVAKRRRRVALPELDAGIGVGAQAAARGQIVPHTRSEGPSGKPGEDKRRQERGVRLR